MARIDKILDKTVRKESEAKKGIVVVGIVVGVLIAVGLFVGGMFCINLIIGGYLQDTKDIINLYDFYDLKVGENETAVFFVGSSIIGCSIYPPKINDILYENNYNITAYSVVINGDLPIERSLEIQKIIDAHPSLIIYGITYRSVTDNISDSRYSERTKLVYSRLNVREDSHFLFDEDKIKYFTTQPELSYKKTFLRSAITTLFFGKDESARILDYTADPYGDKYRKSFSLDKNITNIKEQSNNPNDAWRPVVTNETTRYKDALIYNVQTLQNAGIPVIIINMPLHPLFSEKITDESRQNFYDLLNQTGAKWYDMEKDYGDEFFADSHHASIEGAEIFAPRMADLIIEQVENDVIHYT